MKVEQLAGWIPIRLYWEAGRPLLDWCYLGEERFAEPFFEQTIGRVIKHPFNLLFRHQTPVEVLNEWQADAPALSPKGFIFHMTRCGSTLISQMLAALPQNIVISEASPVDSVLRAHYRDPRITFEQRVAWLRGLISALGQKRRAEERDFFVKFDAWNILDLPLIERAFPGVPRVFVYREPVEVMVSQLQGMVSWMLTGAIEPAILGIDIGVVLQMSHEEYCARVLGRICEAAIEHARGTLLINYRQLPAAIWSEILKFFGVSYTGAELEHMRHVSQFDAKSPSLTFVNDSAAKQREASVELRAMAERWVKPPYERLEELRQGGASPMVE